MSRILTEMIQKKQIHTKKMRAGLVCWRVAECLPSSHRALGSAEQRMATYQ